MSKTKTFVSDFKEFALKGNVIDLAIGVVIGAAFKSIVDSLVADIINPFLNLITGRVDFNDLFITLNGKSYETLEAAQSSGAPIVKYGVFLNNLISFLIIALVIFIIVNYLIRRKKEEVKKEIRKCPYCREEVKKLATKCKHCTSNIPKDKEKVNP